MKTVIFAIFAVLIASIGAFAQSDTGVRARVVTTPTPPVLGNDPDYRRSSGPPVLNGSSGTNTGSPTATPPAEDDEIIKVETNLVTLPVSVLDREGRFISGLQQRDFKIFENGIEQKVDYFQSVEQPFTVVLLIDVSPSTQFQIGEIQDAAITFISKLRPADRVMVMTFDQDVRVVCQPTNDRYVLREAVRNVRFGDGTSLYEAVAQTIDQQLSRIRGRKAVVLFTDGVDTTSRRATYESTLRSTEEVDALFYTIRYDTSNDVYTGGYPGPQTPNPAPRRGGRITLADVLGAILSGSGGGGSGGGGGGGPRHKYEKGRRYLEALAYNTGGRLFEAQSIYNLDAAFSGIAEELRRQYSLGYYPENVGQLGDRKQIKIRVMRPNVVVRAKNSYIVGQGNRNLAGK